MIGTVFNRWTIIEAISKTPKNKLLRWLCQCACGNKSIVSGYDLRTGKSKSCGCLRDEKTKARALRHGMEKTPIYETWKGIIKRCTNPNFKDWEHYGGRGITVCDEWRQFPYFYNDMGDKPFAKAEIDRIDNNKGYFKENCRWVTHKENCNNRRKRRYSPKVAPALEAR